MTYVNQSTVFTEKATLGDLVRHEYNPLIGYTRKKITLYNETGAAVSLSNAMGYPVRASGVHAGAFKLAVYGDEAAITGLLIGVGNKSVGQLTMAIGANIPNAVVLCNGPAIVDQAWIPTVDSNGANFVMATLEATLAALNPPIKSNPENPNSYTQLT